MQVRKIIIKCGLATLVALLPVATPALESPWRDTDRIAISMDGNGESTRTNSKHTVGDPDDIGASAVALAMIAKHGKQDRLVHFDFNNWLDVGPVPQNKDRMTPSVLPARDRWGFNPDVFFDLSRTPEAGIANLTEAINASTADSHLYIIAAGPVESIYRAVAAADADKLQHVSLISHSIYNETQLIQDNHRTIDDFKKFREAHGLGYIKIKDQNAQNNPNYLWHAGKNFGVWNFLRDSGDPELRWLFSRIQAHTYRKSDVSDAGMVFFLLNNDDDGSPSKLRNFLGDRLLEGPAAAILDIAPEDLVIIEAEDMRSTSGWEVRKDDRASGGRYVTFTANNSFKKVTPHRLGTTFEVPAAGRYTVKWFMRQPDGVPGDQCNDAWINFPDAKQIGREEFTGFHKFVGRSRTHFGLNGTIEIHGKHAWLSVEFPKPGKYRLELAGRSQGFQLDRIVLYRSVDFSDVDRYLAQRN
ncbi:MAG: hypothetical protein AAGH99_10770 [Planctomycetota bacterium]